MVMSQARRWTCSNRTGQENILFGNDKVVATPHSGRFHHEAQENVALQDGRADFDYLLTAPITNALKHCRHIGSEAQKVRPGFHV